MSYETVRGFADSWGLLLLVLLFFAVIVFVFRRGSSKRYEEAARIPMESRDAPGELKSDDAGGGESDPDATRQRGEDK